VINGNMILAMFERRGFFGSCSPFRHAATSRHCHSATVFPERSVSWRSVL